MDIARSDIVRSIAGRDKGKIFFVLDAKDEFLMLADGKTRSVETPKRKKHRHVHIVASQETRVSTKIKGEEKVTNSELRKALAVYRDEVQHPDQEG